MLRWDRQLHGRLSFRYPKILDCRSPTPSYTGTTDPTPAPSQPNPAYPLQPTPEHTYIQYAPLVPLSHSAVALYSRTRAHRAVVGSYADTAYAAPRTQSAVVQHGALTQPPHVFAKPFRAHLREQRVFRRRRMHARERCHVATICEGAFSIPQAHMTTAFSSSTED